MVSSRHLNAFKEGLHGSFPEAVFPRVRSLSVIGVHPTVKIFLQLLYRRVYLLSERNGIELVLYRSVEAFTDAVRLWAFRLDFGVVDVLNGQIQFIFMCFPVATVFSSPVSEHPHEFQVMLLEEGYHTVIEHVRRHERILSVIQLGKTDFGIGVDYRLLVNVSYAFDIPYIIGVLRHKESGIICLYLPVRLFLRLGLFKGGNLVLVKHDTFLLDLGGKRFQTFPEGLQQR